MFRKTKTVCLTWLGFVTAVTLCAQDETAKQVYLGAADSVLLIYVEKDDGRTIGQGSGFLVDRGHIVTNAHVVQGGKPFVMIGPAKIPVTVERVDGSSDLALLKPGVELTAPALRIATADPTPGQTVFAIGNPEGLEKTISQGIVSANRDFDGRKLLQITSPISHGSSGGPILDTAGQVIGVTVGTFQEGQNLNFALPASTLLRFLAEPSAKAESIDTILDHAREIASNRGAYSSNPDSEWQRGRIKIDALLAEAIDKSWNDLPGLTKVTSAAWLNSSLTVKARRRLVELASTPENYEELGRSLYFSDLSVQDSEEKKAVLSEAEKAVRTAISRSKSPAAAWYLLLGNILSDRDQCREAKGFYNQALLADKDKSESQNALRGLTTCSDTLGSAIEAEQFFRSLAARGFAEASDWQLEAGRLKKRQMYADAAKAYQTAAQMQEENHDYFAVEDYSLWESAATNYVIAGNYDAALAAARKCIALGEGKEDSDHVLSSCHDTIASILNDRNVYSEALNHAREAAALNKENGLAQHAMATALLGLGRPLEAINAEREALRLTDGKFSWMHFALGSAYFDTENWKLAEQSFRKAAELDTKDYAAAYNVGLCLVKQHYYREGAQWYEEALRRNPQARDRADILEKIRVLRSQ
jgi:tetratricopeptide (TPR) repeat protein